jgi:GNAT superfamily N-acetyltransferase
LTGLDFLTVMSLPKLVPGDVMNTIVRDEVDLSIQQFSQAWKLMCAGAPGSSFADGEGVEYVFSRCPIPFFNFALLTARGISADGLRARAGAARAWASDKQVPWLFLVTHEALDADLDAAALLADCDLTPLVPLTGMLMEGVTPSTNAPSGVELSVPRDDTGCSAILDINAAAYGMDFSAAKDLIGTSSFWANHFPVIGAVGGTRATTASVLMTDSCRYVVLVATDPAWQRRGLADAAMRRALELSAAEHGGRPTLLHATEAGRPVYERMGYRIISHHTIFMEKRFLEEH